MAALPNHLNPFARFAKPSAPVESKRAREFANRVYKETKGATPELKRLYAKLLENDGRAGTSRG
jgi:hypothetical protein